MNTSAVIGVLIDYVSNQKQFINVHNDGVQLSRGFTICEVKLRSSWRF